MGKIVFMFPGQGAQYVGMGKDFYDSFACSKEIFDKANEVLDIDVKKLCFEENEDINIRVYTGSYGNCKCRNLKEDRRNGIKA